MNIAKFSLTCFVVVMIALFSGCFSSDDSEGSNNKLIKDDNKLIGLNLPWNKYKFTANEVNQFPDMIEQTLVDYIFQFESSSSEEVDEALRVLIVKSEQDSSFFLFLREKLFDYLNHPNSPMRNDLYFESVLKNYQNSSLLTAIEKQKDTVILDLIRKNQVGEEAADFQFENKNAEKYKLSDFKSSHVLLLFYDPNCPHCNEVITSMKSNELLNAAIKAHDIVVLAIDPLGEIEEWKKYYENIPKNWVNGIDRSGNVLKDGVYNLQGYPTIYLISPDGIVLLKDVYFSDIEKYLLNFD